MTLARLLAVLAAAALAAACAVGPDYHLPAPMPGTTGRFVSAAQGPFTSEPPAGDWWRLYKDPVLDRLVGEALEANKDIAVAAANLAQVRGALAEARAARLPATTVTGSATRSRQPDLVNGGSIEGNTVSVGFDASYEIDIFGRVRRSIEAAGADAEAAAAAVDVVRVMVAGETARAYADACAANAELLVARRTLDLQAKTRDLTVRQLEAGRGTALDVAGASAEVETTRSQIPPLESQRDGALFRLSVLTGKPPAQFPPEARACQVVPEVVQAVPVGDGAILLRRRPDVRQAERRLAAATARIGVETAALYPSVSLGGSISTMGGTGIGALGNDFQFSIGPLISWTFPNIAVARARITQAGAAADAALAQFEQTNLTALQEVETALTNYARELDRRSALRRARDQSARAAQLAHMRFSAGIDSFLPVLDAERTLASLEAQLAASDAQVATYQIALFKALGGGWSA
jgi:NodT family efflux transporter outer membrane factor (OMF) lipoprotein